MAKLPLTYLGLNQSQIDYISTTKYAKQLQDKGWDIPNNYIPPKTTSIIKIKKEDGSFESCLYRSNSDFIRMNNGKSFTQVIEEIEQFLKKL